MKFSNEQKEILEQNPNVSRVTQNNVIYAESFKQQALQEYNSGKSANQIFKEAGFDISIISEQRDYAAKTLSKWRNSKTFNKGIHYPQKQRKKKRDAYQKLLEKNEYLEAENEFLKKLRYLNEQFR